jgi:glycerol-3-phosphate acyltransferase PlsY
MLSIFVPAIVVAYLMGSIPFAQIIAKLHGKDLRTVGSGNIGATNLARALGRTWGYVCFALDVLKGCIPMVAVRAIAGPPDRPALLALWLAVGIAAILGHVFPVFLGFKGGKGVATSFGVTLGLWPYFTLCGLIALAVWVGVVLVWRYVSLASICASASFPLALLAGILIRPDWDLSRLWPLVVAAIVIPTFVILRHRANIRRLLAGTENKIRDKRPG